MENNFRVGNQLMINLIAYITFCGNQFQMESILI
jgi:hypothetical protein